MTNRRVVHAAAAALSLSLAAACARPPAPIAQPAPADWESRFPPAAGCMLRVSPGAPLDSSETGNVPDAGGLVLRVRRFDSAELVRGAQMVLTPLGVADGAPIGVSSLDSSATHTIVGLSPGRYAMLVRKIGFLPRTDTVPVRAGAVDTADVALETWNESFGNAHRCRPHGFRRAGEPACVTDPEETELALEHARSWMSPEGRRDFGLPPGESSDATVVRDERLCERAGRAYGGPESPPRRVVVVAVGGLFLVYDPFEPDRAGEWPIWMVFDSEWRFLGSMAS